MPLFNFQCIDCNEQFEKFFHNSDLIAEILCPKCGKSCERIFGIPIGRNKLSAKDMYSEIIAPEAKNICDKIDNGSEKEIIDICGEK